MSLSRPSTLAYFDRESCTSGGRCGHGFAPGATPGARAGDVFAKRPLRPFAEHAVEHAHAHAFDLGARPCADVEPKVLDRRRRVVGSAAAPEMIAAHGEHAGDD